MKVTIVVPTIRQDSLVRFLEAWGSELADQPLIIVEDNPERSFDIPAGRAQHYSWQDIERDLGKDAWIIPRRTDCVRSYGYWKAVQAGAEIIITLDDDCYPKDPDFVATHCAALKGESRSDAWTSTGNGLLPRGMPYYTGERAQPCVVNHGLWTNVPDYDAVTQLVSVRLPEATFKPAQRAIPRAVYYPMCGMNLAFRACLAPCMYFLLMGRDWPYDRFGDIWCGLFSKRICDHVGLGVQSGRPLIEHQRASNVWANLRKEMAGYEVNETLWQAIDGITLTSTSVREAYKELARKLTLQGEYWDALRRAMQVWADLFEAQ